MSTRPRQTDIQTPIGKEVLERGATVVSTNMTPRYLVLLVNPCEVCGLGPCACSYVAKMRPEGPLAHLRPVVIVASKEPWPHQPACPCPRCYSLRLASWS